MKAYVVGGAVRDELLGQPVADRDWVVVGSTPEEMAAGGFRPVGRDFPVFLHPQTHEEYALARTERKSGRGYRGFTVHAAPEVTLEDDLRRRDLTINAMARDEHARLVDPFGGERDLREGVLRHVSAAFAEDPVRILRTARFAARFGFSVAPETLQLMREMVLKGEAEDLVPERVWQELARGLCEAQPVLMLEVLEQCSALGRILPEFQRLLDDDSTRARVYAALERAAAAGAPLETRFALFSWCMDEDCEIRTRSLCDSLRAPNDVREIAHAVCRCRPFLGAAAQATPVALLETLKNIDAFRRRERFDALLSIARLALPGQGSENSAKRLATALEAASSVDAAAIAREAGSGSEIAMRLNAARRDAIAAALGT